MLVRARNVHGFVKNTRKNIPSIWIEIIPSFPSFSFQRSAKDQASLCIITTRLSFEMKGNSKFPYYFSFQRSVKAQASLCIVTNLIELQNSRNSKFRYYFSHYSNQRRLRRVCALSLIRLSFKIREIATFYIFSLLMRAAKSQARLCFGINSTEPPLL